MRKLIVHFGLIVVCVALAAGPALPGYAQSSNPTPTVEVAPTQPAPTLVPAPAAGSDVISLTSLGVSDLTLRGPSSTSRALFSLPADWKLNSDAELWLSFATFIGQSAAAGPGWGGALQIAFNGVIVASLALDQTGDRLLTIPIPLAALQGELVDGRYELAFALDSGVGCEVDQNVTVVVSAGSRLRLPHTQQPPATDLSLLPSPIYQASFLPDVATLVIPDQPLAGELQAALDVAAGLGRQSSSELTLTLTTAAQLTAVTRAQTHLILVGRPAAFSLLSGLALPAPVAAGRYQSAGAAVDDGFVQMIISPWNASKVLLLVGGGSETAVIKAGQAFSSGTLVTGSQPNLSVVAEVRAAPPPATIPVDQTLTDLGLAVRTARRPGANVLTSRFYLPAGLVLDGTANVALVFNHSALLDYERSGLVISMNDEPIGSVRLTADTAAKSNVMEVSIPPASVHPGVNRLVVTADLIPLSGCYDPRTLNLWFTLRPETTLHLPTTPTPARTGSVIQLRAYPAPFTLEPTLSTTAFVLAHDDLAGWQAALSLAFDLGDRSDGERVDLVAAYSDAVPEAVRAERDLVLVGRPSGLALLGELAARLPAPFPAGSDLAVEDRLPISYRLAPEVSRGYLELLTSPWNSDRIVLAVLGNTAAGLASAAAALLTTETRTALNGDLAVIQGLQVEAVDTRTVVGLAPAAILTGTLTTPSGTALEAAQFDTPTARPDWVLPVLGVSVALTMAVLGLVVFLWGRGRRPKAG